MRHGSKAQETFESPAANSYAVTPHDSNEVGTFVPRALYVGVGGDIVCQLLGDTADVTFASVPTGTVLPIRVRIVKATGTTASSLVALY